MAFCQGAMAQIRKVWAMVTPELSMIVDEIMKATAQIKSLEANPTIAMIVAIIPNGSNIEAILNTALAEITGVVTGVESFADAMSKWLAAQPTSLAVNAGLVKLASVAVKVADAQSDPLTLGEVADATVKTEKFYDSVVQIHALLTPSVG